MDAKNRSINDLHVALNVLEDVTAHGKKRVTDARLCLSVHTSDRLRALSAESLTVLAYGAFEGTVNSIVTIFFATLPKMAHLGVEPRNPFLDFIAFSEYLRLQLGKRNLKPLLDPTAKSFGVPVRKNSIVDQFNYYLNAFGSSYSPVYSAGAPHLPSSLYEEIFQSLMPGKLKLDSRSLEKQKIEFLKGSLGVYELEFLANLIGLNFDLSKVKPTLVNFIGNRHHLAHSANRKKSTIEVATVESWCNLVNDIISTFSGHVDKVISEAIEEVNNPRSNFVI